MEKERSTAITTEEKRVDLIERLKEILPQEAVDEMGLEEMTYGQISNIIRKGLRRMALDILAEDDEC